MHQKFFLGDYLCKLFKDNEWQLRANGHMGEEDVFDWHIWAFRHEVKKDQQQRQGLCFAIYL